MREKAAHLNLHVYNCHLPSKIYSISLVLKQWGLCEKATCITGLLLGLENWRCTEGHRRHHKARDKTSNIWEVTLGSIKKMKHGTEIPADLKTL